MVSVVGDRLLVTTATVYPRTIRPSGMAGRSVRLAAEAIATGQRGGDRARRVRRRRAGRSWPGWVCARPRSCRCRRHPRSPTSCSCSTAAAASSSVAPICTCSSSVAQRLRIAAEDRERAVAIERLAQSGHLLAPHLDSDVAGGRRGRTRAAADDGGRRMDRRRLRRRGVRRRLTTATPRPTAAPVTERPVADLRAWSTVVGGDAWVATITSSSSPLPRSALCVPVMRDGVPIALLYATRDRARPFGAEVIEIATIFASYLATALENAGLYHELRRRATRDPLTGLANRELAGTASRPCAEHGSAPFTGLLFCDLDGFKAVNDRLGHEAGDGLLRAGRRASAEGPAPEGSAGAFRRRRVRGRPRRDRDTRRRDRGRLPAGPGVARTVRAATTSGSPSRRASAASSAHAARRRPGRCCATPTPPCTSPSRAAPARSRSSTTPRPTGRSTGSASARS